MPPSNAALLLPPLKGALLPPLLPSSRGAPWSDVKYTMVFSSSPAHKRNKQGFRDKLERERERERERETIRLSLGTRKIMNLAKEKKTRLTVLKTFNLFTVCASRNKS